MEKVRFIRVSKRQIQQIVGPAKLLSRSLQDDKIVIKQFNNLPYSIRKEISQEYQELEDTLKPKVAPFDKDTYLTCSMVNFNIIAADYDIDPATVCMCISPPCKLNEKILLV